MNWETQKDIDKIKRTAGVYVLYTASKKLKYVGYSNNIFDRLLKHELSWSYCKVQYLSVDKAKSLEYRLIKRIQPKLNMRHKKKALSAKHRIRLLPETYFTLKIASDYTKIRVADLISTLVKESELPYLRKGRTIAKQMIKEFYED